MLGPPVLCGRPRPTIGTVTKMATIHLIETKTTRSAAAASPADQSTPKTCAGAEIILFPGVRYERWSDEQPTGTAKGHTSRDWLTLAE